MLYLIEEVKKMKHVAIYTLTIAGSMPDVGDPAEQAATASDPGFCSSLADVIRKWFDDRRTSSDLFDVSFESYAVVEGNPGVGEQARQEEIDADIQRIIDAYRGQVR